MDFNSLYPPPSQPSRGAFRFRRAIFVFLALILASASFKLGFDSGRKGFVFLPKDFKIINQNEHPAIVDYRLFWDALKAVEDKYIEKPPTPDKVLYGAIKGAVAAFGDPYTVFFEPSGLTSFKTDLAGGFDGIGAEIGKRDGNIVIISPLDGMPAQKAGILPQDVILEVDGESAAEWSVEEAVQKIRGPKGTRVKLKLFREGRNAPFEVEIVRGKIEIRSLKWEFQETEIRGEKKTLAVLRLTKFGDDTLPLFEKAVGEILVRDVSGIVLDLRNNPGGYLQTAVEAAAFWLEPGQLVVREERSSAKPVEYRAQGRNRLKPFKLAVLINGGSASAAEILAGALQGYELGPLVGETTFGKGSVQELIELKGGTAVKVTVARWITPGGKNLNKEGLHPDIPVKMSEADYEQGRDPQMDRAVEELFR